ncbi:GrpB family protein [Halobacillus rhizosphaerae]|uniref:GrpB family protein n=1 Tax=Halobacillus rhizosphaerae TaxID=3064889 RepID=UPI00398AF015
MRRKVQVVPYRQQWEADYIRECSNLKNVLGNSEASFYHIGSTAIPEMSAKPVIDIMGSIKRIEEIDPFMLELQTMGYESKGEFGIPGRRFFQKGGNSRSHHLHIFQQGSVEIVRHLAFRDYLRSHTEEALRYRRLKEQLAEQHPYNIEAYMEGKKELITEIEKKALRWYR